MILILQIVIMSILLGVSLLVFLLVRQVGVLSSRLGDGRDSSSPSLEVGTMCPVNEFVRLGQAGTFKIPVAGEEYSFLIFISFTCPVCQVILEELRSLSSEVASRMVLLFLDGNPAAEYSRELETLNRHGFPVVEGNEIAAAFKVQYAPHLFVVREDGVIEVSQGLHTFDEWLAVIRKYRPVEILRKGVGNAVQE